MGDSTPRHDADDSLSVWIQETCPELPDILRSHIKTMTDLDGQGQDVLLRLILASTKEKTRKTYLALKIAESVQLLCFNKICSALVAQGLTGSSQRMRDVKALLDEMLGNTNALNHTREVLENIGKKTAEAIQ